MPSTPPSQHHFFWVFRQASSCPLQRSTEFGRQIGPLGSSAAELPWGARWIGKTSGWPAKIWDIKRKGVMNSSELMKVGDMIRFTTWFDWSDQWEFQDPKMEALYQIRQYFVGDIPLHRPYIGLIYGRYLHFRFLKWPLKWWESQFRW